MKSKCAICGKRGEPGKDLFRGGIPDVPPNEGCYASGHLGFAHRDCFRKIYEREEGSRKKQTQV